MKKQIITLIIEGTPEQVTEAKEFILTATADVLRACHVDDMPAIDKQMAKYIANSVFGKSKPHYVDTDNVQDLIKKIFE